jgi:hypothetical protein
MSSGPSRRLPFVFVMQAAQDGTAHYPARPWRHRALALSSAPGRRRRTSALWCFSSRSRPSDTFCLASGAVLLHGAKRTSRQQARCVQPGSIRPGTVEGQRHSSQAKERDLPRFDPTAQALEHVREREQRSSSYFGTTTRWGSAINCGRLAPRSSSTLSTAAGTRLNPASSASRFSSNAAFVAASI